MNQTNKPDAVRPAAPTCNRTVYWDGKNAHYCKLAMFHEGKCDLDIAPESSGVIMERSAASESLLPPDTTATDIMTALRTMRNKNGRWKWTDEQLQAIVDTISPLLTVATLPEAERAAPTGQSELLSLPLKWQDERQYHGEVMEYRRGRLRCASELQAVLAAQPSAPPSQEGRDDILEEAALVADRHLHCILNENCANSIAYGIRALKSLAAAPADANGKETK